VNAIFHLVPAVHWHDQDPSTPYLPHDFDSEGFIHCTQGASLLLQVANTYYQDAPGEFLLLVIDEERVSAEIKYENGFPHIYGPLNQDAIVAVHAMIRHDDGQFELPAGVAQDSFSQPRR
jgi:uncharacterized protein (DUF952 family)